MGGVNIECVARRATLWLTRRERSATLRRQPHWSGDEVGEAEPHRVNAAAFVNPPVRFAPRPAPDIWLDTGWELR